MSIHTWFKERYPVAARDLALESLSDLDLARHCLKKWRGFRKSALKRHGLVYSVETGGLKSIKGGGAGWPEALSPSSCALCARYYTKGLFNGWCGSCPLAKTLGSPCNTIPGDAYLNMSWGGDPGPMIKALEITCKRLEKEEEEKQCPQKR